MTELVFVKQGSKYVSEFEVTKDFNLHIERGKGGILYLQQRTTDVGMYDSVNNADFAPMDLIVDYDFSSLVYPKYIKVVSEVEPSYAAITTDGEVTEIKSQSKEVEITANGKVDVAPDAGYAYLSKVSVNVNVPQSGGGSEEGSANYEYLDMSTDPSHVGILEVAALFVSVAKIAKNGEIEVSSPMMAALAGNIQASSVIAVCVDKNIKAGIDGQLFTIDGVFNSIGATAKDFYDSIPRLTEEEFYNLES